MNVQLTENAALATLAAIRNVSARIAQVVYNISEDDEKGIVALNGLKDVWFLLKSSAIDDTESSLVVAHASAALLYAFAGPGFEPAAKLAIEEACDSDHKRSDFSPLGVYSQLHHLIKWVAETTPDLEARKLALMVQADFVSSISNPKAFREFISKINNVAEATKGQEWVNIRGVAMALAKSMTEEGNALKRKREAAAAHHDEPNRLALIMDRFQVDEVGTAGDHASEGAETPRPVVQLGEIDFGF